MLLGVLLWKRIHFGSSLCAHSKSRLELSFEVVPAMQPVIYLVAADVFGLAFVSCSISWLLAVPAVVVAQVGCPAIVFGNALCLCDTPGGRVDNE